MAKLSAFTAAREGMRRGIRFPEFHARLHHSSPRTWLDILRGPHQERLFKRILRCSIGARKFWIDRGPTL